MQIQGVVSWVWVTPNGSGLDGGLQMDFISTTQQYTKQSCCPCRRTSLQCHQTLLAVLACVEWWWATAAKTSVHCQYTQHAHTSTCYINFVPHIYFTHKVTDPVQHLCSKRLHRRTCSVRSTLEKLPKIKVAEDYLGDLKLLSRLVKICFWTSSQTSQKLQNSENLPAAGAPPWSPLGQLTMFPNPTYLVAWGRVKHPPQFPTPRVHPNIQNMRSQHLCYRHLSKLSYCSDIVTMRNKWLWLQKKMINSLETSVCMACLSI